MLIGFALLQALLERQAAMSEHREFEEREAMIFVAEGSDSERLEAASRSHRRFWKHPWRQSWAWASRGMEDIDLDSTKPPEISLFHQLQRTRSDVAKRPCLLGQSTGTG